MGRWLGLKLIVVRRSPILPVGGLSWDKWSGKQLGHLVVVQDVLDVLGMPSEESRRWLGFVFLMYSFVSLMLSVAWMTGGRLSDLFRGGLRRMEIGRLSGRSEWE